MSSSTPHPACSVRLPIPGFGSPCQRADPPPMRSPGPWAWATGAGAAPAAVPAQALSGMLSGASAAFAVALAAHLIAARTPIESLSFAPLKPLGDNPPAGPAGAVLVSSTDPGGSAVCLVVTAPDLKPKIRN